LLLGRFTSLLVHHAFFAKESEKGLTSPILQFDEK